MPCASLSALAERDLVEIWLYTASQWSEEQADAYLDAIEDAIRKIELQPEIGPRRDYVRVGYRVSFVNHHAIYYTAARGSIHVVRVLHERMDPEGHA